MVSGIKSRRALGRWGSQTARYIGDSITQILWDRLTGRELEIVTRCLDTAYKDGYEAAGGDLLDDVQHCEVRRNELFAALEREATEAGAPLAETARRLIASPPKSTGRRAGDRQCDSTQVKRADRVLRFDSLLSQ